MTSVTGGKAELCLLCPRPVGLVSKSEGVRGERWGGEMVQGLVQMWTFALREAGTPGTLAPLASA